MHTEGLPDKVYTPIPYFLQHSAYRSYAIPMCTHAYYNSSKNNNKQSCACTHTHRRPFRKSVYTNPLLLTTLCILVICNTAILLTAGDKSGVHELLRLQVCAHDFMYVCMGRWMMDVCMHVYVCMWVCLYGCMDVCVRVCNTAILHVLVCVRVFCMY